MSVLNGLSLALAAKATVPNVVRAKKNTNTQLAKAVAASVAATGNLAWKAVKDDASYKKDKAIKTSNSAKSILKILLEVASKVGKMIVGAKSKSGKTILKAILAAIKRLILDAKKHSRKPTEKEIFAKFKPENWEKLSMSRRKKAVILLSRIIAKYLGIENPQVEFYSEGYIDGYISLGYQLDNCIHINMNEIITPATIADTVAHECRHIYQRMRAENPKTEQDRKFKKNFENYIQPEHDFDGYYDQVVEVDARAYGGKFVKKMKL